MSKITVAPSNAIIFVFDPMDENVIVPDYIDNVLVASTETCISIGTQPAVDGETEIALFASNKETLSLIKVFSGVISSASGKIAVITSEFQNLLEVATQKGNIKICVWVDDIKSPSRIVIVLNSINAEAG